jgi:hypothetical protein
VRERKNLACPENEWVDDFILNFYALILIHTKVQISHTMTVVCQEITGDFLSFLIHLSCYNKNSIAWVT